MTTAKIGLPCPFCSNNEAIIVINPKSFSGADCECTSCHKRWEY